MGPFRRPPRIRRPLCLLALFYLVFLLLFQLVPDRAGPDLSPADGRHLLITCKVLSKEQTAGGYQVLVGEVSFPARRSSAYDRMRENLAKVWPRKGRILIRLNAPSAGSLRQSKPVDQSSLYSQARIGRCMAFYGSVSVPDKATNPGQFDQFSYDRARDIFLTMSKVSKAQLLTHPSHTGSSSAAGSHSESVSRAGPASGLSLLFSLPSLYLNALTDFRQVLKRSASSVFGPANAALIDAIVLGDRSGLDQETRRLFQDGGILHILAVSSLHVTLLGASLYKLLRKLRRSFLCSAFWSGLLVLSFCLMTGNSFSAIRAAVCYLFYLGAQVLGRTYDRLTALAASALLILVRHPYALTDRGFLLSFGCILSMDLLCPLFAKVLSPGKGLPSRLSDSLALQAGILPLSLSFFYQVTPYGLLLNLIVLPSMSLFMLFGVLGTLAGLLLSLGRPFLYLAQAISGPCGYLLALFRLLCKLTEALPGDVLVCGCPPVWKVLVYYSVLALVCFRIRRLSPSACLRRKRRLRPRFLLCLSGLVLLLILHPRPAFRFTCLDVGQGSCSLLETGGGAFLFDGGSSTVSKIYQGRIESTLKYYGISNLDLVFVSHGDLDHVNGIEQLLDATHPAFPYPCASGISIGRILLPDLETDSEEFSGLLDLTRSAKEAGIPISALAEGAVLSLGPDEASLSPTAGKAETASVRIRVLSPARDRLCGESNQDCLVLDLTATVGNKKLRILLPGDLEKEGEEKLTEVYRTSALFPPPKGTFTILIAGHHGSKNASSDAFLDLVQPDLVLISCGKNNRYGHPARQMLDRLKAHGIPSHRTDQAGAYQLS